MTRKLPWPCSKIERDVLHSLWLEAKNVGVPMTTVVQCAVNEYLNRRLEAAGQQPQPDAAASSAA